MTGKGGSGGGFRIFPELRKVLGCHMPNFRSLGQSLHIDNFWKIDGGGGGGGGPLLSLCSTKPKIYLYIAGWERKMRNGFLYLETKSANPVKHVVLQIFLFIN